MSKIYFRKILEYDPTLGGTHGRYEGYKKIVTGVVDPEIVDTNDFSLDIPSGISNIVFCS